MIINQKEKLLNAIAYFALEFRDIRLAWPSQKWIYKLLALLDFRMLKKTGCPCLGLEYEAMEDGPVPVCLYRRTIGESDLFRFKDNLNTTGVDIEALREPDLSYFSNSAVDEMEKLVDEFVIGGASLDDISRATHREINAWNRAWRVAQQKDSLSRPMNYEDEFPFSISHSPESDLTPQENAFLMYLGMNSLEQKFAARAGKNESR